MAGNKKPRKKYKRIVLVTNHTPLPITLGLSAEQKQDLRLPYHLALDAMKRGAGNDDEAHLLFTSLLTARELSKKFNADIQREVQEALDAVIAVKERGDKTGKWGVSGDQFRLISRGLVLMDDMQDAATRRDVRDALTAVWDAVGNVKRAA